MNVETPQGAAVLERARELMEDLRKLKLSPKSAGDAQTIADQLLVYIRQQFGGARLPDLSG